MDKKLFNCKTKLLHRQNNGQMVFNLIKGIVNFLTILWVFVEIDFWFLINMSWVQESLRLLVKRLLGGNVKISSILFSNIWFFKNIYRLETEKGATCIYRYCNKLQELKCCQLMVIGANSTPTRIPSLGCSDERNLIQCRQLDCDTAWLWGGPGERPLSD